MGQAQGVDIFYGTNLLLDELIIYVDYKTVTKNYIPKQRVVLQEKHKQCSPPSKKIIYENVKKFSNPLSHILTKGFSLST